MLPCRRWRIYKIVGSVKGEIAQVFCRSWVSARIGSVERRVPLNFDAMLGFRLMFEQASQLGMTGPEHYVFPACEHNRIDGTRPQKTWRTAWRNLTRAAGLRGLPFQDLRHQCITELLEAGAPEAAVLSIAGHVSRKMMEHYSHIRMEAKRKAIEGLVPVAAADSEVSVTTDVARVN